MNTLTCVTRSYNVFNNDYGYLHNSTATMLPYWHYIYFHQPTTTYDICTAENLFDLFFAVKTWLLHRLVC